MCDRNPVVQPTALLRCCGPRLWDVVYDFEVHEAEDRIRAWCDVYDDVREGEWSRGDLEEHVRDEHSTFSWIIEPMIERCGFEIQEAQYTSDGFFGKYISRAT